MDRTLDFGSNSEGSNPSAVTMLNNQPAVFSVGCFVFLRLYFVFSQGKCDK